MKVMVIKLQVTAIIGDRKPDTTWLTSDNTIFVRSALLRPR